jgi:signal transduction histidine kinase
LERSLGPSFNIEIRFPLSLKQVEANPNQLELALLNLALNARDAMPDRGNIILSAREENLHGIGTTRTFGVAEYE